MALQLSNRRPLTVGDVIITGELLRRPPRAPNPTAESEALHSIAASMSGDPQATLDALVNAALKLCGAGAVGVSLLDKSAGVPGIFNWVALAGTYASYVGNTSPGDFSPCGTCLGYGHAQLFFQPARYFTYLQQAEPPIVEGLVVPFQAGEAAGTIWVVSHHDNKQFTSEDVRVLTSLGKFAGAAFASQFANAALRMKTRQLEELRKASAAHEQFAVQVVENSDDCIKVLDLEGRLLSVNTPGLELLEIDDFSKCENEVWTQFWQGSGARDAQAAVTAAKSGNAASFEGRCFTMKETPKWWQVSVTPILDAQRKPERLLVVSRDVTAHREAEKKIREALEVADAANRKKDLFLAALSHELRTPLSPVVLAIAAMRTDPSLSADLKQYLEMIQRNVELEVRLIDDLLDVSRAASGKLRINAEVASVHILLKYVQETCASDASRKHISCQFNLDAANDTVMADLARLQQVFWNVLKNAIKFSNEGQTIEVSTSNPSADVIEIQFKDHGMGIKSEAMPRLFDVFDQGESTTTQKFGGLGLGLAISKGLIEQHGGTIEPRSAGVNQGATFVIRLPTRDRERASVPSVPAPIKGPTVAASLRLLIVEDHEDTARVLSRLLASSGFKVRTAGCAADALAAIESEPVDIVLSDVGLPDTTGYELMQEIRKRFNISGIAMTGYGMDEDFVKSREAGFVAHVVKPINLEQLEQVIRRVADMPV